MIAFHAAAVMPQLPLLFPMYFYDLANPPIFATHCPFGPLRMAQPPIWPVSFCNKPYHSLGRRFFIEFYKFFFFSDSKKKSMAQRKRHTVRPFSQHTVYLKKLMVAIW